MPGRWRDGGARPDMANMTDEQRARFRAMRQQRQAEGGGAGETSRPITQETPAQPTQEQPVAKEEETEDDGFGGLFGGFFEEAPIPEAPTQPDATELKMQRYPSLNPV